MVVGSESGMKMGVLGSRIAVGVRGNELERGEIVIVVSPMKRGEVG